MDGLSQEHWLKKELFSEIKDAFSDVHLLKQIDISVQKIQKTEIITNNEQVSNVQINVMVPKEILANKNELGRSRTSNEDSRSLCSRTIKRNDTEADSILFEQKKEALEKLMSL